VQKKKPESLGLGCAVRFIRHCVDLSQPSQLQVQFANNSQPLHLRSLLPRK
jgi:hypothetical protein